MQAIYVGYPVNDMPQRRVRGTAAPDHAPYGMRRPYDAHMDGVDVAITPPLPCRRHGDRRVITAWDQTKNGHANPFNQSLARRCA